METATATLNLRRARANPPRRGSLFVSDIGCFLALWRKTEPESGKGKRTPAHIAAPEGVGPRDVPSIDILLAAFIPELCQAVRSEFESFLSSSIGRLEMAQNTTAPCFQNTTL